MSVQFRSRIKSVIDYSKTLNGIGVCCDKNGNKSLKAFYDCFNDGGNYFPGDSIDVVDCPPADTQKGCCCACSYVTDLEQLPYPWDFRYNDLHPTAILKGYYYDSGVVCGVTRCECERLKGKFTPSEADSVVMSTPDDVRYYCYKDAPEFGSGYIIDARYPRACCHVERNPETGYPTNIVCDNVCSNYDCAILGNSTNPSVYDNLKVCGRNFYIVPGSVAGVCGPSGEAQCNIPLRISQIMTKTTELAQEEFGSCYELVKSESGNLEYECDIKPQSMCGGYWTQSQNAIYCNDVYTPNNPLKVNNLYDVQKLTLTQFNNLNLTLGQEFQGGIYIGIYEPGSPINSKGSELYGNLNFTNPDFFYPDNIGVGGPYKKWAIIVDEKSYYDTFLHDEEDVHFETSLWDGYYNTYGNLNSFGGINTKLMNTIRYKDRNGFIDYYVPSIYEMYFYWSFLIRNRKPKEYANYITSSLFTTKYINQTSNKTKINNNGMVYGGKIQRESRYKTILIPKNYPAKVMFFRKIVIQD